MHLLHGSVLFHLPGRTLLPIYETRLFSAMTSYLCRNTARRNTYLRESFMNHDVSRPGGTFEEQRENTVKHAKHLHH
ncbi:hypothetical protein KCU85_g395, partial [Aureobasidium melanogenum]